MHAALPLFCNHDCMVTVSDISNVIKLYLEESIDCWTLKSRFGEVGIELGQGGTLKAQKLFYVVEELFQDMSAEHLAEANFRICTGAADLRLTSEVQWTNGCSTWTALISDVVMPQSSVLSARVVGTHERGLVYPGLRFFTRAAKAGTSSPRYRKGFQIVRAVNRPNVKVLYDFYHEQRGGGNLIAKLESNIDWVGLVHIADVPGRHEAGTGEINYANVYRCLGKLRYNRFIGMEYGPTSDPVASLSKSRIEAQAMMREGLQAG